MAWWLGKRREPNQLAPGVEGGDARRGGPPTATISLAIGVFSMSLTYGRSPEARTHMSAAGTAKTSPENQATMSASKFVKTPEPP
jgi:hypothetical protein